MQTVREHKALEAYLKKMRCPTCDGKGKQINGRICHACEGSGSSEDFRKRHEAATYGIRGC